MELAPFTGPWSPDDPDANFKAQVAEYSRNDPLPTLETLSRNLDIPVGALARYVLVRWAAEGSEALLATGPRLIERLWTVVTDAEADGSDEAKLQAFDTLRQMLSWLRVPLQEEPVSPPKA